MTSRARTLLAVLALLTASTAGCSDDGPAPILRIEVSSWNGWEEPAPGAEPRVAVHELRGAEGEEVTLDVLTGELRITVDERDGDALRLELDQEVAPLGSGGGMSLNDLQDEFALEAGDTVRFSTPTMDAGTTVEVTWP